MRTEELDKMQKAFDKMIKGRMVLLTSEGHEKSKETGIQKRVHVMSINVDFTLNICDKYHTYISKVDINYFKL